LKCNGYKTQRIHDKWQTLFALDNTEAFEINASDLTNLPILLHQYAPSTTLKKHFIPANWWTHCNKDHDQTHKKIIALANHPNYIAKKFRAMLEKIIMPFEIIQKIADFTLFNPDDKKNVLSWMKTRQEHMAKIALDVPGFSQYVQEKGEAETKQLSIRFRNFILKRQDFFSHVSTKHLYAQYDANFSAYKKLITPPPPSLPPPTISLPYQAPGNYSPSLLSDSNNTTLTKLQILFNAIKTEGLWLTSILERKKMQQQLFNQEIKKLTLDDLTALSDHMQTVQLNNKSADHVFNIIRTERINFLGGGNTQTWREMRSAVKNEITKQLNTKLSLEDFNKYDALLNQHSGRFYARGGRTASNTLFHRVFSVKEDLPNNDNSRKLTIN
jgi:hypothetical protein